MEDERALERAHTDSHTSIDHINRDRAREPHFCYFIYYGRYAKALPHHRRDHTAFCFQGGI